MAGPLYFDRVKETTSTTGTGTYTLAGAVTGFQAFSAIGNGNTCYYATTDGTNWEVGLGTYTLSGTTLARTTILASSNAGSAVSWSAGSKYIWCEVPASAVTAFISTAPALVLLGSGTATAQATVDIAINSYSYRSYVIQLDEISGSTTGTDLQCVFSIGGVFQGGTSYRYYGQRANANGGAAASYNGGSGAASIVLIQAILTNVANQSGGMRIEFRNLQDAARYSALFYAGVHLDANPDTENMFGSGIMNVVGAVDKIRLQAASGTVTLKWSLYGVT